MSSDRLGVAYEPQHGTAYVKGCVEVLKDDPKEIYKAAAEATRISDYVCEAPERQRDKPIEKGRDTSPVTSPEPGRGRPMPTPPARTMQQRRAWIVRAMLLLVRGYSAAKNLWLTDPVWPVKHDKDMEACEDMNDKSKPALSLVTPQARHHFTRLDQVDRLVGAGESDPEIAYMGRLLALCSLPRTNPGQRLQYKRANGPYQLYMVAGAGNKLPYGNIPRLLLAWFCTEVVRTQSRDLILGKTLSDFMRVLGIDPAGASFARVRNQMKRLFGCSITLIYEAKSGFTRVSSYVADKHEFWWVERNSGDPGVFNSSIRLGEEFLGLPQNLWVKPSSIAA